MRDKDRVIFKAKNKDEYYFYDGVEEFIEDGGPPVDVDIIGFVSETPTNFHECKHSAIWEEIKPDYVDELQNESDMPEGKYAVCWYEYGSYFTLYERVDYGITKEQIIQNVINQKYREGADYYLMDEIEPYVPEVKEESKLKKYRLTYEIVFEAEAEDEDHALELADTMWEEGNFELHPYIEEVED